MTEHQWQDQKGSWFFNCIGLIDGTLSLLAFAPMVYGEDYYTRKGDYTIKGLVIFDDAAMITWVEMGPGRIVRSIWVEISILIRRSMCLRIRPFQPQQ